jgi:hypothetical protein
VGAEHRGVRTLVECFHHLLLSTAKARQPLVVFEVSAKVPCGTMIGYPTP